MRFTFFVSNFFLYNSFVLMASAQDVKRIDTDSEIQEYTSPVATPLKYGKCETVKVVARPSVKRGAVSSPEV